jgi:hypothetical protein
MLRVSALPATDAVRDLARPPRTQPPPARAPRRRAGAPSPPKHRPSPAHTFSPGAFPRDLSAGAARYGCGVNRRPRLRLLGTGATPEEAAAVVAAIEQFLRDTAPPVAAAAPAPDPWLRAARLEAVGRDPDDPGEWFRP